MSGPKPILLKIESRKNTTSRTPSRVVSRRDNLEGGQETEIAANISVPKDGGWGWVVVICAFFCCACLDGICYTFGSLLDDICKDFNVAESLVALVNSIAVALYYIGSPFAAAFINRFGFRACVMCGSVTSSLSLFISYFSTNIIYLIIFYGVFGGIGFSFINMSAGLVVGYYFEKKRAIAVPLATCGSSFGTVALSALNSHLVGITGWRPLVLLHCGLIGLPFFFGMTFQPLLSFTVAKEAEDPTRTITFLPSLSTPRVKEDTAQDVIKATAAERMFSAVSNYNFPTVAAVVQDEDVSSSADPSTGTSAVSRLTLTANAPHGGISRRHLNEIKSFISKKDVHDTSKRISVTEHAEEPEKPGCCGRICRWEKHVPQARPMYRDDAFYDGKVETLDVYQKSMMNLPSKTGLEYQLAVTRAATAEDVQERRGVFTTAARRILATMLDLQLLRQKTFLCYCAGSFFLFLGILIPYVYIHKANLEAGLDPEFCNFLVSVIAVSNAVGRILSGVLALKINPFNIYTVATFCVASSAMLSILRRTIYFQVACWIVFGYCAAATTCLRSLVLVKLYGLENLTNATGVVYFFQGIACVMGTPLGGILCKKINIDAPFVFASLTMYAAGILAIVTIVLYKKGM